jgi:head-tail adaptor
MLQPNPRLGGLRHRVQIQRPIETRDAHGGTTQDWTLEAVRDGRIISAESAEPFNANKKQGVASHYIDLRYYSGIDETYRFVVNEDIYSVLGQGVNYDGVKRYSRFACKRLSEGQYETAVRDSSGTVLKTSEGQTIFTGAA